MIIENNAEKIVPNKVTKPIQLLAAWLVGLVAVNGSFLGTAIALGASEWERSALIIAAILNVPFFLFSIFILQTKFRPELQEDSFYHQYLNKKNDTVVHVSRIDLLDSRIVALEEKKILTNVNENKDFESEELEVIQEIRASTILPWRMAVNDYLPNQEKILEDLEKIGLSPAIYFGEATHAPKITKFYVSINENIEFSTKIELLRVLTKYSCFVGYQFWKPVPEYDENEDIYLGSYGIDHYIKITDELRILLQTDVKSASFNNYNIKNYRKVFKKIKRKA